MPAPAPANRLDWQHKAQRVSRPPEEYLAEVIRHDLTSKQGCRILDLGSANGLWGADLADLYADLGWTFTNIDYTERYIPEKPWGPRQEFLHYDVTSSSPPRSDLLNAFDLVHLRLVFNLLPKWPKTSIEDALASITQFIKPNGWVQFDEFCYAEPWDDTILARKFQDMFPPFGFDISKDERIYRLRETLQGLLQAQGFKDVGYSIHDVNVGKALLRDDPTSTENQEVMKRNVEGWKWVSEYFIEQLRVWHPEGYRSVTPEDYDTFPERFKQDLLENGQTLKFFTLYGRKS